MPLRVKLEIVPFGDEDKAYEIGRIDVFNKGASDGIHHYGVLVLDKNNQGMFNREIRHNRSEGAWVLIKKVLDRLIYNDAI